MTVLAVYCLLFTTLSLTVLASWDIHYLKNAHNLFLRNCTLQTVALALSSCVTLRKLRSIICIMEIMTAVAVVVIIMTIPAYLWLLQRLNEIRRGSPKHTAGLQMFANILMNLVSH